MIAFPVLQSLTIDNYGLYPSEAGAPFAVVFQPGPTLVVGVNGSGKTTLISICLRCLTGPYDLPAATSESELGQVRPRAVRVSRPMLVLVLKAPAGEACALIADQLFPKGFAKR